MVPKPFTPGPGVGALTPLASTSGGHTLAHAPVQALWFAWSRV